MDIEQGKGFTRPLFAVFCTGDELLHVTPPLTSLSFIISQWITFCPCTSFRKLFQRFVQLIVRKLIPFLFPKLIHFRLLYYPPNMTLWLVLQFLPHAKTIHREPPHFICAPIFVCPPKVDSQFPTRMTRPSFHKFWSEFIFA